MNQCQACIWTYGQYKMQTARLQTRYKMQTSISDKRVQTLNSKVQFSVSWKHPPLSPKAMLIFLSSTADHRAYTTLNWGAGGIRELHVTLDANKIEQMLQYQKASFPKSVSTTLVTH